MSNYKKYLKLLTISGIGITSLTLTVMVTSININKTKYINNELLSKINRKIKINEGDLMFNVNKLNCSTSISTDLKSITKCNLHNVDILLNEKKLSTIDNVNIDLKTSIFAINLRDFLKSKIDFNIKMNNLSISDTIFSNFLEITEKEKKGNEVFLNTLKSNFKGINVLSSGLLDLTTKNISNYSIKNSISNSYLSFIQYMQGYNIKYNKNKVYPLKDNVDLNNSTPKEAYTTNIGNFINKNNISIHTKDKDKLLKSLYAYYRVLISSKLDRFYFNKFYLNQNIGKIVNIKEFEKYIKPLISLALKEYKLDRRYVISLFLDKLFNDNSNGVCYKVNIKDKNNNIDIEYLKRLYEFNEDKGLQISQDLIKRESKECSTINKCIEYCL